jgi:hypothetical protein
MSTPDDPPADELPPTALASLVTAAKEKFVAKPDRHGPAAVKAMAAVVRDLKGMPELSIVRESATRLRLTRKGRDGFVVIEYDAAVLSIDVSAGGFGDARDPGAKKADRFGLQGDQWMRMEGGGDIFTELHAQVLRLYPELRL